MAGELANEILHFQSLGITNVSLSCADRLGRAGEGCWSFLRPGIPVGFLGIPNLLGVGQAAGKFA